MRTDEVKNYCCPVSHQFLRPAEVSVGDAGEVIEGKLMSETGRSFPIRMGLADFVYPDALCSSEESARASYDKVAESIYDAAVDWQFRAICESEDSVREDMLDLLGLESSSRVLEVGCGTGRDSFRIARRLGRNGSLYMQDISPKMVFACRERMAAFKRDMNFEANLSYFISNASYLPFPDCYFDSVFHFGGFNEFGDQGRAAEEFARVTKVGGRVVFGDESVAPWLRGTEFEGIVTTNNPMFLHRLPLETLPLGARDVQCKWIMGNCFYLISFTKGVGAPPLDLDLPHQGRRGGTMRTRYFGKLEGVTLEAKDKAIASAAAAGKSIHQWLDDLINNAS